jgi:hypothetical protein
MACYDSEFNFWNLWIYFGRLVGLLGRGIGSSQGHYLYRTAQHRKTRTHTHALSEIRTPDPRIRAVEDSTFLRPHGHWNRLCVNFIEDIFLSGIRDTQKKKKEYRVITNDVSDYINLLVSIAHIICNHTLYKPLSNSDVKTLKQL